MYINFYKLGFVNLYMGLEYISRVDKLLGEITLEEYNKRVLERSNEEVFSSDKGGTTILLLQTLFKNFNKSAKIIGTSLCSKIIADEECRKRLDMFESPISIILTNSPNYMSEKIKNYFFNNLNSKVQPKEMYSHLTEKMGKEVEFLVLNDLSYFFEINVFKGKVARCNFNNPQGALHLSNTFDTFYNKY